MNTPHTHINSWCNAIKRTMQLKVERNKNWEKKKEKTERKIMQFLHKINYFKYFKMNHQQRRRQQQQHQLSFRTVEQRQEKRKSNYVVNNLWSKFSKIKCSITLTSTIDTIIYIQGGSAFESLAKFLTTQLYTESAIVILRKWFKKLLNIFSNFFFYLKVQSFRLVMDPTRRTMQ